jgi:protein-tyrosine phosphatase
MAQAAWNDGVTTIVCTPHLREYDWTFIETARGVLRDFRVRLSASGVGLRLLLGFEVDVAVASIAAPEELRELVFEDSRGTLLIEVPHFGWPFQLRDTIFRLCTEGFIPVLAHPERNDRIQRHPALLEECVAAGAVAQVTAASLDGGFGRAPKAVVYRHLVLGNIGLLASDAHSFRRDSWTMANALSALRERLSDAEVDCLARVNPGRLLTGEPLVPVVAAPRLARRGLRGWF